MNVLERIRLNAEGFSRKMGVLAKFVVDNINDIGVIDINSAEIARRTGASEATITRFIQKLGYRNFPEFRAALRQQFHSQLSSRSFRMEQSNDSEEPVYVKVFNLERSLMEESLNMLDPMTFGRCVDMICSSEELLLVGCSPNSFLVDYAYSFLRLYRDRVHAIKELDIPSLGLIMDSLPRRTVALVFSFPRYPRDTQQIIRMLHDRDVRTIGITDSEMSPIVPFSDTVLFTPHKYLVVTDPVASVVSLIHALIVGMYKKDPRKYKKRLQKYEALANESDSFVNKNFSFAELL